MVPPVFAAYVTVYFCTGFVSDVKDTAVFDPTFTVAPLLTVVPAAEVTFTLYTSVFVVRAATELWVNVIVPVLFVPLWTASPDTIPTNSRPVDNVSVIVIVLAAVS